MRIVQSDQTSPESLVFSRSETEGGWHRTLIQEIAFGYNYCFITCTAEIIQRAKKEGGCLTGVCAATVTVAETCKVLHVIGSPFMFKTLLLSLLPYFDKYTNRCYQISLHLQDCAGVARPISF